MTRRVLVTDADAFLGPACAARLRARGDDVTAVTERLASRDHVGGLVGEHGPFDVVVANLD